MKHCKKEKSLMKSFFVLVMITAFCNGDESSDLQKAFVDNEIIPALKTAATTILSVSYPGDIAVNLGNELKPTQTKDKPEVKWEAEKGAFYTLIKIDLDAPNRKKPIWSEIRHWLVMNIPEVEVEKGDEIVEYIGAGPPPDGGLHRYVFLVFKQPNGRIEHNEPRSTKQQWINRANTSVIEFMRKYKLGDPEYGNFYQGQWDEYSDILKAQLMG